MKVIGLQIDLKKSEVMAQGTEVVKYTIQIQTSPSPQDLHVLLTWLALIDDPAYVIQLVESPINTFLSRASVCLRIAIDECVCSDAQVD